MKIVGATVFLTVFSVVPYGKKTAPTTGVSHLSEVGNLVENRRLKAELLAVPSGTETKSVTVIPGWRSKAGPFCASAPFAHNVIDNASTAEAANPRRSDCIDYRPRIPSAIVAGTLTDSLRMYARASRRFAEIGLVRVGEVTDSTPNRFARIFNRSI
jgi:hypothetical protein